MSASRKFNRRTNQLVVCVRSAGYEVSLERGKIYQAVSDARAVRHHLLRVIDESGEGYLYPKSIFLPIELPKAIERVLFALA